MSNGSNGLGELTDLTGTVTIVIPKSSEAELSPEQSHAHVLSLHDAVVEIKATLNNGLKAAIVEQKAELKQVKSDVQAIRDAVHGHIAKEDVIFEIFRRTLNVGIAVTGTLVMTLFGIIGWLITHPQTFTTP